MSATLMQRAEVAHPAVARLSRVMASNADIARFRRAMQQAEHARRNAKAHLREGVRQALAVPLSARYALRGMTRNGRRLRQSFGIGYLAQCRRLMRAYHRGIPLEDFYAYRMFLPEPHVSSSRQFPFSQVLGRQQDLTDIGRYADFPDLRSKRAFAMRCAERDLPTVPLVAEFFDGRMRVPAGNPSTLPHVDLFSKPSGYWCGVGTNLWRFQQSGGYRNASGEQEDAGGLIARLLAEADADVQSDGIVLQRRVCNHPAMLGSLTTGGLSTVRVVTCVSPSGVIEWFPPVIRMPINGSIVDNIAQGGVAAPIDAATGRLCGPAVQKDDATGSRIYDTHPDTGVAFHGFQLPFWNEVVDLANKAHATFPSMPFVGWDIAILPDGPVVLEGNPWWDVDLTVLPHGLSLSATPFIPYWLHHLHSAMTAKDRLPACEMED